MSTKKFWKALIADLYTHFYVHEKFNSQILGALKRIKWLIKLF